MKVGAGRLYLEVAGRSGRDVRGKGMKHLIVYCSAIQTATF